jgi:hypothetical protein
VLCRINKELLHQVSKVGWTVVGRAEGKGEAAAGGPGLAIGRQAK